jgi:hypothetical protein
MPSWSFWLGINASGTEAHNFSTVKTTLKDQVFAFLRPPAGVWKHLTFKCLIGDGALRPR